MSKMRRLLSVLMAAFMLLTLPLTTGIARAVADGTNEPAESGSVELEMEDLDPATLHVHKLGEVEEEEAEPEVPSALITELDPSRDPDEIVRVSIFLDGKSTIEQGYSTRGIAENSSATAYRKKLQKQQDDLTAKIEKEVGHELNVKWNLTLLANAISVEVPYKDTIIIARMPGVKSVEFETQYEAPRDAEADHPNTANTSENMVGATTAWAAGYTGAGSRIAIIDTGLDTAHQSFNADAFNYAITQLQNQTHKTYSLMTSIPSGLNGNGTRISAKIPYAYNYVDGDTTVNHASDTQGEHGSHVAGIAAANRYIKSGSSYNLAATSVGAVGMAPDAQLCIMKVFGSKGGAYDSDYMVAIEDAIVLDCDSCNLSLGSSVQGWTFDNDYQDILNNLVNKEHNEGMVVSISAGNSYSIVDNMSSDIKKTGLYIEDVGMHTGGSPGTFINSLCVAAAQNTKTTGTPLTFNGSHQVFYAESLEGDNGTYSNPAMTTIGSASGTSYNYVYIDAVGSASDYSTVNSTVSLSGKIVIVNRGELSFYEKGNNAKSYSPKAVIVANNEDGTIYMQLDDYTGTFPMVSISLADANQIKSDSTSGTTGGINYYTGTVKVTTTETSVTIPRADATITSFSSWGVPGSLIMKPEITAPGGDIYSVNGTHKTSSGTSGGTDQYEYMSGTSMAAPHITGLSAVVAQYIRENPIADKNSELANNYSTRAIIQSLLMSTATPMKNNGNYVSILQQGAGLAQVAHAVNASSVIMMKSAYLTSKTGANADGKVKVELGDDPTRTGDYTYTFDVFNITDYPLHFNFDTKIFTQQIAEASDGLHMAKTTWEMGATVTHTMSVDGETPVLESHDVDMDGDTDADDAQAILDYLTGEKDETEVDLEAAEMGDDDMITSHDAYLLLNWTPGEGSSLAANTVPAHGKGTVTVHIVLDPEDFGTENYPTGAYIEGFTYVTCDSTANNGVDTVSLAHEHTIPILGFYGSWTDPSMFDAASYVDSLYMPNGVAKTSYTGNQDTNYIRITSGGTTTKFSGNPYKVEESFPVDRLAMNSNTTISNIAYNLVRAASTTAFAVTQTDGILGNNTAVKNSAIVGEDVYGIYYSTSGGWLNLTMKTYNVGKTPAEYGLTKDQTFRVGFYAIPEYNGMVENNSYSAAGSGVLSKTKFENLLTSNKLGRGAFIGYDFIVDNEEPTIGSATLNGNQLSISAADDHNLAYVAVLSLDGETIYAEETPGTSEYNIELNASTAIANAHGYVAVFAGDYAGNEVAKAVKVNDNTYEEKTVYVLTNTLEAGEEYLIVNSNATGNRYALGHSGTTVATNAVTVKAGIADTYNAVYIESGDVASTSIWTVASGYTFKNGNYYLGYTGTRTYTLAVSTTSRNWTWAETNNRLSVKPGNTTYYLRYSNGFSIATSTNSIYLYKKTIIRTEIDPYGVTSVTVTPTSLDLYKGNTAQLTAKVMPLTATDRTVRWTSSNENVATVDSTGLVTAKAAGSATITATSNGDATKTATCAVTVTAVNKTLNSIIWDEEGKVFFSSFNANNLPTWSKLHNSGVGTYLQNAYMADASTLYASTCDVSGDSIIYTVNRSTYALTQFGVNYVAPFGMARASTRYTDYFVYGFAKYLIFGNLTPVEDDDGTYSGLPYGLIDLTTTNVGDAYVCGICARSIGTTSSSFYFLDETGKIWQTTMSIGSSVSFGTPSLVVDTGIGTSFQYQNLYYDGTYLYWSHCDGSVSELIIINPTSGKVYHAGNFGEGVWPATGMYVNGSVAPASVGDEYEVMGEGEKLEGLKPVATRDELMTPEVMARFAAEAEKFGKGVVMSEEAEDPFAIVEPVEPDDGTELEPVDPVDDFETVEPEDGMDVVEPTEPEDGMDVVEPTEPEEGADAISNGAHRAHLGIFHYVSGTATDAGVLPLTESVASYNGVFAVEYTPSELHCTAEPGEWGTGANKKLWVSIFVDEDTDTDKGVVTVAYAVKGETALPTDQVIATLTFTAQTCSETGSFEVEVDTLERNTVYDLGGDEEIVMIDVPAGGHVWGTPTYEWTQVENGWTCTATAVCERNSEHTLTETVTAGRTETADKAVYTATFENEAFEEQVKEVDLGYYLVGSFTEWAVDTTKKFEVNSDNASEYLLQITLAAGAEFKAVKAEGTTIIAWYPVQGTNYVVGANQAGDVTVFFRPDGQGGEGWHYGYLYIATQHVHIWSEPTYEWAADNSTVTATRSCTECDEVETETVSTTLTTVEPTCTEAGSKTWTSAAFENPMFEVQTKTETIPATGHDWDEPTYEWAADNSTVTATRVCANDATHVETETVNTTSEVKTAATCEGAGTTTYTATFENEAFETQTKDVEDIDPIGHDWDTPTYTWDENNNCTAERVCKNDATHKETELAPGIGEVTKPATCEEAGETTYTATFANEAFEPQTKVVADVEPIGHDWDEPTYEWAADNSTVTATRVCKNDESHVETETVNTTSEVKTPATCEGAGTTTYTATFENEAFETQTKDVEDIEPIGHDWDEPTYEWAADNSTVTATRVCTRDESHVETETVNTSYAVTTEPTTTAAGVGTYTATFQNSAFETQTKTVEIPMLTETFTVAYIDVRHNNTVLQVFHDVVSGTATPEFTGSISTYEDCRYDPDNMWTTPVAQTVTADAVYVLKWINVYTVTFQNEDGTTLKTVKVDENAKVPAAEIPEVPEKEGYTLSGWLEGSLVFDLDTTDIVRDVTLKPNFTINTYTVTFDPDNGEATFTATVTHGGTVTAPEQPINGNKVFDGWYNGETKFDFSTPITGNLTLTAHWSEAAEKVGTTIEFVMNDESAGITNGVDYNKGTQYVVYVKGTDATPAFTVVGEDDAELTSNDFTFEYLYNNEPGTGYVRVTVTKDGYDSPADAWFKIYLPASTGMTAENVDTGIKLTWEAVEDADGYVIYRRAWNSTSTGWTTFERWNNTTETEWIDTTVYAGTRYQYGVKAYFKEKVDPMHPDKTMGGKFDNYNLGIVSQQLRTMVRITTRQLSSVTPGSSSGQLTVKWAGSKVFEGYEIQYATNNAFTDAKTVKITSKTTYSKVLSGLTSGTTYYVRVRSYQPFSEDVAQSMTYYGSWSNVMNGAAK